MCGDWGESSARNDPHSFFHLLSHSFIHFSFALPSAWSSLLLDSHIYPSHRVSGFCSGNSAQRCFEPACLWPPEHSTHSGEGRMDRPPGYGDLLTCFPGPRGESALSALLRSESGGGMFTTFHQHPRPCSPSFHCSTHHFLHGSHIHMLWSVPHSRIAPHGDRACRDSLLYHQPGNNARPMKTRTLPSSPTI